MEGMMEANSRAKVGPLSVNGTCECDAPATYWLTLTDMDGNVIDRTTLCQECAAHPKALLGNYLVVPKS
jgi:hypothetical protein